MSVKSGGKDKENIYKMKMPNFAKHKTTLETEIWWAGNNELQNRLFKILDDSR